MRNILVFILLCLLLAGCAGGEPYTEETPATGEEPAEEEPTEASAGVPTAAPQPTADPAEIASAALAELEQGQILYNPPAEMQRGERDRLEVRISLNPGEDLAADLQGRGEPVQEQIPVARFMTVRLTGTAFEIIPLSSAEQVVARDAFTQWAWDIIPLEGGEQRLSLIVTARVKIPGYEDEARDLQIIEREILVTVTPTQAALDFVGGNLEWIGPAILAALAAAGSWAWNRRRIGKNRVEL
jgi:hypothetical protein